MNTPADRPYKIHEGRNVKRFREMMGIKQEVLALELGGEWSQKKISVLESKEKIEDDLLAEIAKILKVPEDAIRNFDEEKAVLNIQNNYQGSNQGANNVSINNNHCTFNPIDKLLETVEELKSALTENKNLYERLLASEKEKLDLFKNNRLSE
jgi:transcriptional regulator with XRE-family HTH domain